VAFALSSIVGAERQWRGKSAGLRTQAIVGTASALIVLVSKYGFTDVIVSGRVMLDPSRVAAQIVSGIGFLGAGLIITRRGAIRGLTTAAAVWETAAIGMAAGAGLLVMAGVVTILHFVIVGPYTALVRRMPATRVGAVQRRVLYSDHRGALRLLL
jgi:putative Mg2+ transporter-C (MgtC) family protein